MVVVIVISHAVLVKTYWRTKFYWRYIYCISLWSSLFPIDLLRELLIPIGSIF
jgi:hypothetical protein